MDSTLCAPQFAPFKVDLAVAKAERHSWSRGTRQGQYQPPPPTRLSIFSRPGGGVRALESMTA
jgi:hypothetical protein